MQNAQRDMLRESQAQNARLIEQFQAMLTQLKPAAANEAPSEWNQLTVKCTFDAEDGPPAAGINVRFYAESENTRGVPGDEQDSDAEGMVDFGRVLYGTYGVSCKTPDGIYQRMSVSVRPGQPKLVHVICPSAPPPMRKVEFDIQPPDAWHSFPLYYLAVVETARQQVGDQQWSVSASKSNIPSYLLGANGALIGELDIELSKALSEYSQQRGRGVPAIDSTLQERVRDLQTTPVSEQPGYLLSGPLIALMAAPEQPVDTSEGQLPALMMLTIGDRRSGTFGTDSAGTIRLGQHAKQFWMELAQHLVQYIPEQDVYQYSKGDQDVEPPTP
jgi:hypothetical protein